MGSKRVLIAFGSRAGATSQMAAALVDVLRAKGMDPVVADTRDVRNVAKYTAVLIVSGVSVARWRREAVRFLSRFRDELSSRAVWMVHAGSTALPPKVKALVDQTHTHQTTLDDPAVRDWAGRIASELTYRIEAA